MRRGTIAALEIQIERLSRQKDALEDAVMRSGKAMVESHAFIIHMLITEAINAGHRAISINEQHDGELTLKYMASLPNLQDWMLKEIAQ